MVGQREDRHGRGPRHVVLRQTGAGLHEARRHERSRRRLCQFGHDRSQRRPGGRRGRRPVDALVAERTGLALLRQIRLHPGLRTLHPAGDLRHGALRLRLLGALPHPRTDAPDHAHGPFARRRRDGPDPRTERLRLPRPRTHAPVGAHAGQLARALQHAARGVCPLRGGGCRQPLQHLPRRGRPLAGYHRLRHRLQLPDGELSRRMPAPRAQDCTIPAAARRSPPTGLAVRLAAGHRGGAAARRGAAPRHSGDPAAHPRPHVG